jgi:hypothetical protein
MSAATPLLQSLDWAGSALGPVGAYTLAAQRRFSRYGWWAFLLANLAYIALAAQLGLRGLLFQQAGFVGSSLYGIFRSFGRAPGNRGAEAGGVGLIGSAISGGTPTDPDIATELPVHLEGSSS